MYQLLVPVDDDLDRSMRQATYVTDLPGTPDEKSVVITHVLNRVQEDAPAEIRQPERVKTVKHVREFLAEKGYDVSVVAASAPPTEGIQELADEEDVDVIVMGGRKRSPAGKALFGSVTQSVLLNTDRPVVITGGGE